MVHDNEMVIVLGNDDDVFLFHHAKAVWLAGVKYNASSKQPLWARN